MALASHPSHPSQPSPSSGPSSSRPSRRRQRSARVVLAVVLLVLAALAVAGAAVVGTVPALLAAGALAVVLGAVATRVTHTELTDSRREAAADRAAQAQAYRDLAAARVAEHGVYVRRTTAAVERQRTALAEQATTITGLVEQLAGARTEVAESGRALERERDRADRAEAEGRMLTGLLDQAEERAAEAIVRLAELEDEHRALRTTWEAAQAGPLAPLRKHA